VAEGHATVAGKSAGGLPMKMRWPALGAGVILIAAAFFAAARVADTREGLIYEVVTLLGGLTGELYRQFAVTISIAVVRAYCDAGSNWANSDPNANLLRARRYCGA